MLLNIFPMNRFVIVEDGCPACLELEKILPSINMRLKPGRKIREINNTSLEAFNIKIDFVQDKLKDEDFKAYPILYLDGALVLGATKSKYLKIQIENILSEELKGGKQ